MTCGRSPLRALKTMDCGALLPAGDAQPQWVSRANWNFRRRRRAHTNATAVAETIRSAVASCQSILPTLRPDGRIAKCFFQGDFYGDSPYWGLRLNPLRVGKAVPVRYSSAMSTSVFRWQHRVTYAECTVGNHVYYARYLDILEEARGEFLRHTGQPLARLQESNVILPVIEARLRYRGAARYDDVLTVEVAVAELAKVRIEFSHRILHQSGRPLVEGWTVHACTSLDEKPKRIPEALAAALSPFLITPVRPE